MEPSKFTNKFVGTVFKEISDRGWLSRLYYYMIDSKTRTQVKVTDFLSKQIATPNAELWSIAQNIRGEFPNPDLRIIEILKFVYKGVK